MMFYIPSMKKVLICVGGSRSSLSSEILKVLVDENRKSKDSILPSLRTQNIVLFENRINSNFGSDNLFLVQELCTRKTLGFGALRQTFEKSRSCLTIKNNKWKTCYNLLYSILGIFFFQQFCMPTIGMYSLFWQPAYNYLKRIFFLDIVSRGYSSKKFPKTEQIIRRKLNYMEKTKGDLLKPVADKKERKVIKTETNREVVRFQFEIDPEFWKSLEFYQELGRIPTKRELLNNALSLFRWAAKHKERGHSIVALDSSGKEYELELPCLDSIEVNSKQKQLRLVS
jgi:hypothetical protein